MQADHCVQAALKQPVLVTTSLGCIDQAGCNHQQLLECGLHTAAITPEQLVGPHPVEGQGLAAHAQLLQGDHVELPSRWLQRTHDVKPLGHECQAAYASDAACA